MTRSRRAVTLALALVLLFPASSAFAQAADASRIGTVSLAYVAQHSKTAQAAIAQLEAFGKKKSLEVESRAAALQKQQAELQQQSSVMSPRAVADLQKAFDKSRVEFTRIQQDAKAEIDAMQQQFEAEFQVKLQPIIAEISKEKGLHFVFGIEQASMLMWWSPSVDISEEVVKRLDAPRH